MTTKDRTPAPMRALSLTECDAVGGAGLAYDAGHAVGTAMREAFSSAYARMINYQFQQVYT